MCGGNLTIIGQYCIETRDAWLNRLIMITVRKPYTFQLF